MMSAESTQNTSNEELKKKAEELERLREQYKVISVNFMVKDKAKLDENQYMDFSIQAVRRFGYLLENPDKLKRLGFSDSD